ncbi:hypothetical protein [Streptomyces pseudovenezuelae]|uniref:hypothetical protein n=1 Tax=Streptomyces pseudovenezuelae TaxID=67350 RepID=UPI002E820A39|nr:hypothetical protein [Streptomyces pseudovenezuelae]WUA93015.1 hypothetical protein OHO81_39300 [Streptomyces pseudovenezuelae]
MGNFARSPKSGTKPAIPLQAFFTYAADEIDKGQTPDPAGVAGPIPLNMPRREVHKRLRTAKEYIDLAIEHEKADRPLSAQHALHQVLPELVTDADGTQKEAARLARTVLAGGTAASGLGLATRLVTPNMPRAWGD